jgi:hypothetical protein
LTGQVTDSVGSEGDLEQTVHHVQSLPLMITRELTNLWTGKLTASRQNQVSVTGQPVTGSPEVYNAYLAFYAKPGRLMKTPEPPPPGAAILVRCAEVGCDDFGCGEPKKHSWWCRSKPEMIYYWVPCAYKDDFRELCLYAVALRGEVQAVPDYFEATILGVTDVQVDEKKAGTKDEKKDEQRKGRAKMTIVLDKEVPNADGYLIATIKGRLYESQELILDPIITRETPAAQPPTPGHPGVSMTKRLLLSFGFGPGINRVDATPEDVIGELAKQTVRLKFQRFSPPVPKTSDLLQQIRNQLELIRLDQQLQRVP